MLRERFTRALDPRAAAYSESTAEDAVLLPYDLWGSLAHATMLGATGIVPPASARRIVAGLRGIAREVDRGRFPLDPALEDVHLNVEAALTRRLGADGARLHTGRSRNDQVAVDLLLYLRDALLDLEGSVGALVAALVGRARGADGRGVVAGWTHLQPAQRVYWAQLLGTHALRFARDGARLRAIRAGLAASPLGSGALAGSSLPLDRRATARRLGFAGVTVSSVDAVSDRDAALESLAALALLHLHASALAEELVLGSMPELGRVVLDDPFVTTSSLMPHKRNPDLAELVRASAGPAIGRWVAAATVLKGLPLGYQRDLQATKAPLLDGCREAARLVELLAPMVASARFVAGEAAAGGDTASVELADALVRGGRPFRDAHGAVAAFVARLAAAGRPLSSAGPEELRTEFPELPHGWRLPTAEEEPERRRSAGGSAWSEVDRLVTEAARRGRRLVAEADRERRRLDRLRAELGAPRAGPRTTPRRRSGARAASSRPRPPRRRRRGR